MPALYNAIMAAVAVASLVALVLAGRRSWKILVFWPIPAVTGAWACSVAACDFPREVLARTYPFALLSVLFLFGQMICWRKRALKGLILAGLLTCLALAVDLWWQRYTTRSLFREIRAPLHNPYNQGLSLTFGSLGNRNDSAAAIILWPLSGALLQTHWAWGLLALGLAPSCYLIGVIKARQSLLGLLAAAVSLTALQASRRARIWIGAAALGSVSLTLAIYPELRERLSTLIEDPSGGRLLPIAYGFDLFLENPVFGIGPSLYGHYYVLGVRQGWTWAGQSLQPIGTPWVHCLPAEVLCDLGLLGGLTFALVLGSFVRRLRRALVGGREARNLAAAIAACSLSMAAVGLVDLSFIKAWVCTYWWLLLGLGFAAPTFPRTDTHDDHA